jgi:hypothetical protein
MSQKYSSGTSVQKTFKQEVVTLFARATVGASGAVTLVTADGASKLASIVKDSTGQYTITFDLPVQQFLGSPVITVSDSSDAANTAYPCKVISEDTAAGSLTFVTYVTDGNGVAVGNPPNGGQIQITAFVTTSPVF